MKFYGLYMTWPEQGEQWPTTANGGDDELIAIRRNVTFFKLGARCVLKASFMERLKAQQVQRASNRAEVVSRFRKDFGQEMHPPNAAPGPLTPYVAQFPPGSSSSLSSSTSLSRSLAWSIVDSSM